MSKLLEQLINELCPDGVEYKTIGDVCIIKKGSQLNKDKLKDDGKYPVINGGINPSGFWDEYNFESNLITISQGGASAGYVNFMTTPFWAGAHCYVVEQCNNYLNYTYLYHFIKMHQRTFMQSQYGAGIPSLSLKTINSIKIPVPPLEVQDEIVKILDNFTKLTAELTAELTARKQQYEYYRDNLFVFSDNVLYKPLQEIADIGTGSSNTNEELEIGEYPFFVRSQEVRRKDSYEFDETAIITSGDGVGVGKIFHYIEGKYALHQRAYRIHINTDDVIPKYYFYYMKSAFLSYIEKNSFHSSVTSIRRPMLNNFPVPIPYPENKEKSLAEQQRIVDILDRFDKFCNDISEGLPAEIESRQKQYEYYRDKLLSFKKKEATEK